MRRGNYKPVFGNRIQVKPESMKNLLAPLGQKQEHTANTWVPIIMNVLKETSGPLPSPTPTPTPTPAAFNCEWSAITAQWNYNTNDWDECQAVPMITPTNTPTQSLTPSTTPSNTPTPSSTSAIVQGYESIFDAANYSSGTYWNSQTGGLRFALFNGPQKINDYGGMISFDGVNDYGISLSGSSQYNLIPSTSDWTLELWYVWSGGNPSYLPNVMLRDGGFPTADDDFVDGRDVFNQYLRYIIDGVGIATTDVMGLGVPEQVVYTYSGGTMYVYRNNTLIDQATQAYPFVQAQSTYIAFTPPDSAIVDYGIIRTYPFALTPAEISTNWNATKTRYGL